MEVRVTNHWFVVQYIYTLLLVPFEMFFCN